MNLSKKNKILIILLAILVIFAVIISSAYLFYNQGDTTNMGSNSVGSVTKTVYDHYNSNTTIVLITGIHPRETLAIEPEQEAAKKLALLYHVKVINYNVKVTQDANDFSKSRYNGEHLVAEYVVPDMNKTKPNLVIISHSHEATYGKGFYVATPAMDNASVYIAQSINNSNINFNYYAATNNSSIQKTTSGELVSKPIANSGYPTLVYEVPENITKSDSTSRTYDLLITSLNIITNNTAKGVFSGTPWLYNILKP